MIALSEFFDYQGFDETIKTDHFPVESFASSVKFSIETLMEEVKPVVTEIYEIE